MLSTSFCSITENIIKLNIQCEMDIPCMHGMGLNNPLRGVEQKYYTLASYLIHPCSFNDHYGCEDHRTLIIFVCCSNYICWFQLFVHQQQVQINSSQTRNFMQMCNTLYWAVSEQIQNPELILKQILNCNFRRFRCDLCFYPTRHSGDNRWTSTSG